MSTLAWPRPEALDEVVSPAGAPPEERPSTLPPPSGVVAAGAGLPASLIGTQIRLSSEAGEFVALVEGIYGSGDGATSWIKLTVESAEQGTIHMASNGEWFKLPNGHVVQLRRHPSKGRMLAELLRARLSQPGEFVTHEQLIAAIWPNEKMLRNAARTRLYTLVTRLRSLGLRDVLQEQNGYRFSPLVEFVVG